MDVWSSQRTRLKCVLLASVFFLGVEYSTVLQHLPLFLGKRHGTGISLLNLKPFLIRSCTGTLFGLIVSRLADTLSRFWSIQMGTIVIALLGNLLSIVKQDQVLHFIGLCLTGAVDSILPLSYGKLGKHYAPPETTKQFSDLFTAFGVGLCTGSGLHILTERLFLSEGDMTNRISRILPLCCYVLLLIVSMLGIMDSHRRKQISLGAGQNESGLQRKKITLPLQHDTDGNGQKRNESERKLKHVNILLQTSKSDDKESATEIQTVSKEFYHNTLSLWQFLKSKDTSALLGIQVVCSQSVASGLWLLPLIVTSISEMQLQSLSFICTVSSLLAMILLWSSTRLLSGLDIEDLFWVGFVAFFIGWSSLGIAMVAEESGLWGQGIFLFIYGTGFLIGYCFISISIKVAVSSRVNVQDQTFPQAIFCTTEKIVLIGSILLSGPATLTYFLSSTFLFSMGAIFILSFRNTKFQSYATVV